MKAVRQSSQARDSNEGGLLEVRPPVGMDNPWLSLLPLPCFQLQVASDIHADMTFVYQQKKNCPVVQKRAPSSITAGMSFLSG